MLGVLPIARMNYLSKLKIKLIVKDPHLPINDLMTTFTIGIGFHNHLLEVN